MKFVDEGPAGTLSVNPDLVGTPSSDASAEPPPEEAVIATVPSPAPNAGAPTPRRARGYVTSWPTGRTCAATDCETSLSRYNKDTLCWRHAEKRDTDELRASR